MYGGEIYCNHQKTWKTFIHNVWNNQAVKSCSTKMMNVLGINANYLKSFHRNEPFFHDETAVCLIIPHNETVERSGAAGHSNPIKFLFQLSFEGLCNTRRAQHAHLLLPKHTNMSTSAAAFPNH